MGRMIAKFGERYTEWSTVTDSPVSPLLTLPEFKRYLLETYGVEALEELPRRLARVDKFGSSSQMGQTAQDLLRHNRAGPNESHVTTEEEMLRLYGPALEHPGFTDREVLDLDKLLVIRDPYGFREFTARVTVIVAKHGDVILGQAVVPDIDGTFPVLFERDGTILTKNFADLRVMYEEAASANPA